MIPLLDWIFRDLWHFLGTCVLLFLVGIILEAIAIGLRGQK